MANLTIIDGGIRRSAACGLCAVLVGVGLGRFAYTPLLPALVVAGWLSAPQAAYVGAANLAGYLGGALLARPLSALAPAAGILRAMMLLASTTFLACALPLGFKWFLVWRFVAGVAGGVLMVVAASTVLPSVPAGRRGLAGGIIFTGVGIGIIASGWLVPVLLHLGLAETWLALGAVAVASTLAGWRGWPEAPGATPVGSVRLAADPRLWVLYLVYGLGAVGLVGHMIFVVDHVARGLGLGIAAGGRNWIAFGLGALAGPLVAGLLADRIGFRAALRSALCGVGLAVAVPVVIDHPVWLGASSAVVGAFVPGIVPLVVGRVQELVPGGGGPQQTAWGLATVAFAVGQAGAAYGFSRIVELTGDYRLVFRLGALALLSALLLDLVTGRFDRAAAPTRSPAP